MLFLESLIFTFVKLFNYKDGGGNKKETYVWNLLKLKKNVNYLWIFQKNFDILSRGEYTSKKKNVDSNQQWGKGSYMWRKKKIKSMSFLNLNV